VPTDSRAVDPRSEHARRETPLAFLWESVVALLPRLAIDVGGTTVVYWILFATLPKASLWPVLGASLVPAVSNVVNLARRRTVDIVGLFVLLGMIAGLVPAAFGGTQRLLLVRESLVTGLLGAVLLVSSFFMPRPIGYYVIREFLTADDALPQQHFEMVRHSKYFRRGVRIVTMAWGMLLLGELALRGFMAMHMNVAFVLSASPLIFTVLMLLAGIATAVWLGSAISRAQRAGAGP